MASTLSFLVYDMFPFKHLKNAFPCYLQIENLVTDTAMHTAMNKIRCLAAGANNTRNGKEDTVRTAARGGRLWQVTLVILKK